MNKTAPTKFQREKIIFCVDLDVSMEEYFYLGERTNESRINRTKQLLKWYIEQKSSWNPNHEYAIVVLGENAAWHMDFTSDVGLLAHAIDELVTMGRFNTFDSSSLFQEVLNHASLDDDDDSVVRILLIYTRSDVLPTSPDPEIMRTIKASGRAHFDCVYIHNKASEVPGNIKPQLVYDRLCEMEDIGLAGYCYELTRIFRKYSAAMGELLANPATRRLQDNADFKMPLPPSLREAVMEDELTQASKLKRVAAPLSPAATKIKHEESSHAYFSNAAASPVSERARSPREMTSPGRSRVEAPLTGSITVAGPGGVQTASNAGTGLEDAILL